MYYLLKRTFDILSSGIAILILSPLLIPVIIGLKLTGEGYIFYKQERVGYKNKPFLIWKFATMLKDSANMPGGIMTTKKILELLPWEDFLGSLKLMNYHSYLIFFWSYECCGPRPVMKVSFEAYPNEVQKVIYNVKPGLTGIGSIIFRDEEELITEVKNNGGDLWEFYKGKIYPFKGN